LASASPVIAEAIKNNQLKVVSAYYELATGAVSLLA
jgi:carbonic anhydrase